MISNTFPAGAALECGSGYTAHKVEGSRNYDCMPEVLERQEIVPENTHLEQQLAPLAQNAYGDCSYEMISTVRIQC